MWRKRGGCCGGCFCGGCGGDGGSGALNLITVVYVPVVPSLNGGRIRAYRARYLIGRALTSSAGYGGAPAAVGEDGISEPCVNLLLLEINVRRLNAYETYRLPSSVGSCQLKG